MKIAFSRRAGYVGALLALGLGCYLGLGYYVVALNAQQEALEARPPIKHFVHVDRASETAVIPPLPSLEELKTFDQIRQLGVMGVDYQHPADSPRSVRTITREEALGRIREIKPQLNDKNLIREEVEKELKSMLYMYYLADLQVHVKELDAVKTKVAESEAKLQKRLQNAQEAIDLQMKIFKLEADGLRLFLNEQGQPPFALPNFGTPLPNPPSAPRALNSLPLKPPELPGLPIIPLLPEPTGLPVIPALPPVAPVVNPQGR